MLGSVRLLARDGPAATTPSAALWRLPSFVFSRRNGGARLPFQGLARLRWESTVAVQASPATEDTGSSNDSLAIASSPRFNEIGVQQLSSHLYKQLFPLGNTCPPSEELINLAKRHLAQHDLLNKNTDKSSPVAFDLPPLVGQTLDEHFHKLGVDAAEPFLTYAKQFAQSDLPEKPTEWVRRSGWTKYYPDGRTEAVSAPQGNVLTFDTEVMWKISPFAVMACAASPDAWYAWISPWLLGETENDRQLIPLGDATVDRVVVGHNVGYDRARILEEYDLDQTRNSFLDTMSLHVAVNGMCSRQRPTWMKHKKHRELRDQIAKETSNFELTELLSNESFRDEEEELWVDRSSINSLRDVAKFHLDVDMDKEIRNSFGELDRQGVCDQLQELLTYCAADVAITHRVYQIVFPNFLEVCPHPVSFAALRHLSSVILPVNKSWDAYIANSEATYHRLSDAVQERLVSLTNKALEVKDDPEKYSNDPWMQQLDWSGQEIRMVKGKKKNDPPRPAARQKMPGMPMWYKALFPKTTGPINVSVRTRIAPLLLRLSWEGYPLFWSDKYGWTYRVPREETAKFTARALEPCDFSDSESDVTLSNDASHVYFKLPHKDGPTARCTSPMAKSYLPYFEKGTLTSEYSYAKEALEMNASCSYWISARDRIMSQMVVYENDVPPSAFTKPGEPSHLEEKTGDAAVGGFILPQIIPMGTITRRAVENTWLTASNAKKNRVGSELKAMVRAPPRHVFVGADVDSEELWIASVVGDATFRLHGGNAIGFMTLEGTKAAGTDLHSRTASILGITRNDAKVFNYGRIYGAGLKFAAQLLRQFNPSLSEKETLVIASKLYATTKGAKTNRKTLYKRPFWRGGTESFVFNKLEEFAEQERPRTPVLGAGITEALMGRFISKGGYLTSRINWAIQSSGVDYLHLLIVAMDYLIRRFNIAARLSITVHDEIRYLVKDQDKYRAAMALQVANVWTRVMFAQQVGIHDLPQSCAFFSAIDIDKVLRKEVDMDCITPSNPTPIPHGESIDITALLEKGDEARLDPSIVPNPQYAPRLEGIQYTPRKPIMEVLGEAEGQGDEKAEMRFIRAQITNDDAELREILKEGRKPAALPTNLSSLSPASGLDRVFSSTSTPATTATTKAKKTKKKVAATATLASRAMTTSTASTATVTTTTTTPAPTTPPPSSMASAADITNFYDDISYIYDGNMTIPDQYKHSYKYNCNYKYAYNKNNNKPSNNNNNNNNSNKIKVQYHTPSTLMMPVSEAMGGGGNRWRRSMDQRLGNTKVAPAASALRYYSK
ncbi:DNA polymerase gamma, mitochondrial [Rhypophila decipiens]